MDSSLQLSRRVVVMAGLCLAASGAFTCTSDCGVS